MLLAYSWQLYERLANAWTPLFAFLFLLGVYLVILGMALGLWAIHFRNRRLKDADRLNSEKS